MAPIQEVLETQAFSLKQYKQIIIYQFLQVRILYICGVDRNLVKNNSEKNDKTPVSCIFIGSERKSY